MSEKDFQILIIENLKYIRDRIDSVGETTSVTTAKLEAHLDSHKGGKDWISMVLLAISVTLSVVAVSCESIKEFIKKTPIEIQK